MVAATWGVLHVPVHIIVVGCGRVGSGLARALEAGGHSVAIIDQEQKAFDRFLGNGFGGRAIRGVGFDRDVLLAAGVEEADALAAVTDGDNSNILTARIAREHFGVKQVVARIYDARRAEIYARLGIPTVATVPWTIDHIARFLVPADIEADWVDPTGAISLVERPLPGWWIGRPLAELEAGDRIRLVGVNRGGGAQLATAGLVAQDGDTVFLAVRNDAVDELAALLTEPAVAGGHA